MKLVIFCLLLFGPLVPACGSATAAPKGKFQGIHSVYVIERDGASANIRSDLERITCFTLATTRDRADATLTVQAVGRSRFKAELHDRRGVLLWRESARRENKGLLPLLPMLAAKACEPGTAGLSHAAPTRTSMDANGFSSGLLAFLLVGGLITAVVVLLARERAKYQKTRELAAMQIAETELDEFCQGIAAGSLPNRNEHVVGVNLKPDEICRAISWGVQQLVPQKNTRYVGGSHGVSVRIMKGVSYRVGSYRGHPVTTISERVADQGNLYVTTERILFAGSAHVTSLAMKKVASARVDRDRVCFIAENKAMPLVFRLRPAEKYRAELLVHAVELMATSEARRVRQPPGPGVSDKTSTE